MGAARRVVRAGRAAVGAERSPSARGWHAVVEQVGRALAEQALVGDARARLHDAAAHPARARVTRCGRRADDDHRRSQDDFLDAGVEFAAAAPVEMLVVDELLHRRRPMHAGGADSRGCVRFATCSQAVDVSRTRRRQGSVGGLGSSSRHHGTGAAAAADVTSNLHAHEQSHTDVGLVVARRQRRHGGSWGNREPCAVHKSTPRDHNQRRSGNSRAGSTRRYTRRSTRRSTRRTKR